MKTLFNPFEGMTRDRLMAQKDIYERLLNEQSKNYIPPINKKTGKTIKPPALQYMVPIWERGLQLVLSML